MNEPNINETGPDVPGTFHADSGHVPTGGDILRGVRQQGAATRRHGRRRTRVLATAGAVAAVAAAAVAAALLTGPVSDPPSALTATTGALARTSADSYSFSLDTTLRLRGRELRSDVVTGAFDPRHELGAERLTAHTAHPAHSARAQIRFIGKYVYTQVSPGSAMGTIGRPWDKTPAPPTRTDVLQEGDRYGFSTEQPVSPAELLGVLRSAATVRDSGPASGPGWNGTRYAFTVRLSARESLSGTVYVDQQGRVRRLVTITSQEGLTTDRELTFGDFGAPVPVTTPPASQVKYTSGRPYWGFYF